jgi:hypothetical protein
MTNGMIITGLLAFLALMIAIAHSIMAVWRAVVPPSGIPRTAGCGSCGYELGTVAASRCPECGADLLRAGVATRAAAVRLGSSLPSALTGWTLLVLTIAIIAFQITPLFSMNRSFGASVGYTSTHTFAPVPPASLSPGPNPSQPADFRLTVNTNIVGISGQPATSGDITLGFSTDKAAVSIAFDDASTADWILTDASGTTLAAGPTLRSDDVLAAFIAIGLDPAVDPDLSGYADRIEILARSALSSPHSYESIYFWTNTRLAPATPTLVQVSGSSRFASPGPFATQGTNDLIPPLIISGVCIFLWILGIVLITRRRARLIAGPRAPNASAARAA